MHQKQPPANVACSSVFRFRPAVPRAEGQGDNQSGSGQ